MLIGGRRRASAVAAAATALLVLPAAVSAAPAAASSRASSTILGGDQLAGYGVRVNLGPDASPLPAVAAKSWVLADLTTGEILAAKGAHRQGRPASTLKTLTALTLMPVLDKDAEHTVTWKEASADGGRVGIVPDATYTNWDLWHGLLLPSGNDAAAALAGSNGGMKKTVADMQAVARSLQADDTVVRNASGLDADGQLTSAYDLALIARAAMQLEDFRTVTATISYDFPGRPAGKNKKRPTYKIYTQNRLLLHGFPGTVGGKTGYTTLAGRTFWGAAERGGHVLAVTLLQVRERTETAAKDLLTWGFANRTKVTPVGTLVGPRAEEPASPAPSASATAPAAGGTDSAGGATTEPGQAGSSASPLLIALVAALLVGAAAWWFVARRGRAAPEAVPDLRGPSTPSPPTPAVVLPEPVAVAVPEAPAPPEPAAAPPSPAPDAGPDAGPDVRPAARPLPSGNVRVVRPPSRPGQPSGSSE